MSVQNLIALPPERAEALAFATTIQQRLLFPRIAGLMPGAVEYIEVVRTAENVDGMLRMLEVYCNLTDDVVSTGIILNSAYELVDRDAAVELVDRATKIEMENEGESHLGRVLGKLTVQEADSIYYYSSEVELVVAANSNSEGRQNVTVSKWLGTKLLHSDGSSVGYIGPQKGRKVEYEATQHNGVTMYEPKIKVISPDGHPIRADLIDAMSAIHDFQLGPENFRAYSNAPPSNEDLMLGFYMPDSYLKLHSKEWRFDEK